MPPLLAVAYAVLTLALAAGVVLALAVRARERRLLGPRVAAEVRGRAGRVAETVLVVAAAAGALTLGDAPAPAWIAGLAALAVAFVWLRPSLADRVCGEGAVRRGWAVCGYAELEEWRLTGDHLRFRLRGEWDAVPLPSDRHAPARERLVAAAPDRESRFKE